MTNKQASAFQSMLWSFQELHPDSSAYNLAYDLSFKRDYSDIENKTENKVEKIKSALTKAIKNYPLSQAQFEFSDHLSVKIETSHVGYSFNELDSEINNGFDFEKESRRLASIAFNLNEAKWIKIYVIKSKERIHFLFITHHIIWDGSCFEMFLTDFVNTLTDRPIEKKVEFSSPLAYLDYLKPENSKNRDTVKIEAPQENDLAFDFKRPKISKRKGDRILFTLDEKTTKNFIKLAFKLQVTPYQLMLAYTLVWSGQATRNDNPTLVSPFSNRSNSRCRFMKGPLVGMGRSSVHLTSETTWSELLGQIKSSASLAKNEALNAARGVIPFPRSSIILTFQNQFNEIIEIKNFDDLYLTSFVPYASKSDLEWVVHSSPQKKQWNGWLEFDSELFKKETAEWFIESWIHGISELSSSLEKEMSQELVKNISFLPKIHLEKIEHWNDLDDSLLPHETLTELLNKRAILSSQDCALIYAQDGTEKSLSFFELAKLSDQLAFKILSITNGRSCSIGISFYRSAELVIAILASLKAGCAYVPMDPELPNLRLLEMLEDCQTALILTSKEITKWKEIATTIPIVAYQNTDELKLLTQLSLPEITPADAAYIIFTSGSTGKPKGAINSHKAIVNRLKWHQKKYQMMPGQRVLQKTPYTFDVSVWEFFWPLLEGGTLVMPPPGSHKDPESIAHQILKHNINFLHFVPSMLEAFLDEISFSKIRFPSLKKVLCSGEALSRHSAERFFQLLPEVELHNLYGPTECAVDVTATQLFSDHLGPVTIGKPIDNVQINLINSNQSITPLGWPGEIVIGGMAVGEGYFGNPDLTSEKFITHKSLGRVYRTGDLARFLPNGEILYLGRIDQQVKLRGLRIELEEIESRISAANPEIRNLVRLKNQEILVAYLKLSEKVSDADALKIKVALSNSLAKTLPDYMVPTQWRRLDSFPVSSHGKSDLVKLDEISTVIEISPILSQQFVREKFTPLEGLLIPIWEEVLQKFPVSVTSSFFELGGDSLKVLRIRSKLRPFGFDFNISPFMMNPSLKSMANLLEINKKISTVILDNSYVPSAEEEIWLSSFNHETEKIINAYPARELELALSFIAESRSSTHPGTYHDVFHLKIPTVISSKDLEKRWNKLCELHSILRANLHMDAPEKPLWVIRRDFLPSWHNLTEETKPEKWIEILLTNKVHPLDLKNGPLVRLFCLQQHSTGMTDLILSFHHAALDGWSASVLITSLLSDQELNSTDSHDEKNIGSSWHKEQKTQSSDESKIFWKSKLKAISPTILEPISSEQKIIESHWSGSDLDQLHSICGKNAFSLKSLLLAIHMRALQLITHTENVTSGVIANGRDIDIGEETLGLFLLTLPISTSHTGNLISLARDIQSWDHEVEEHKYFPLSKVIQTSGYERIFNTAFNFTQFDRYNLLMKQNQDSSSFMAYELTEFALLCNWHVQTAKKNPLTLRLAVQWGESKFTPAFLVSVYQELIKELLIPGSSTRAPLENIPDYEAMPVLSNWKKFSSSTPDHLAVCFNDGDQIVKLSYRELELKVEEWVNRLNFYKVKRASVELPRSPESVAILLALAHCGISIIPIDQTLPIGRQSDMLLQSRPEIRLVMKNLAIEIFHEENPFVHESNSFYILFTSGTTGRPKGIEMGRKAFERLIDWQIHPDKNSNKLESRDEIPLRTLQFASWSFDVAFQEIFSTLCSGGTLLIPMDEFRKDLFEVNRWIHLMDVERIFLPFVLLNHFCASSLSENIFHKKLKTVITAGEQLEITPSIVNFFKAHPKAKLFNQYGPTESHVVTEAWVDATDQLTPLLPPIGPPTIGVSLSIVNSFLDGNPIVKNGLPGELWIGGSCLAHGYLIPTSQWIERSGRRWYKSGDLVRNIASGAECSSLQYLGRIDNQVKINGQRIELLEIESQLLEAARGLGLKVDQAVAWIIREQKIITSALVFSASSLVNKKDSKNNLEEQLLNILTTTLPHVMIPARIFFLTPKELPLTSNGKVNRLKLAQLGQGFVSSQSKDETKKIVALNPIEKEILKTWESILGRPLEDSITSSSEAHFGKLGGNSLTYLRLIAKLSKDAGRKLKLDDLLRRPTLALQARWIQGEGLDSRRKLPETCIEFLRPIRLPKATLVLLHPIGGSIQCYEALVDSFKVAFIERDIRIIAIQSPRTPINSIPTLAEKYLEDLKSAGVLIEGHPLHLMGWSFGGVLAVEMTAQLEKQGLKLASLNLLDSIALKEKLHTPINMKTQVEWFFWELLGMFQSYPADLEKFVQVIVESKAEPLHLDMAMDLLAQCLDKAREFNFNVEIEDSEIKHFFSAFNKNLEGLQTYIPTNIRAEINLFRCQEKLPERLKSVHQFVGTQFDDPSHGWQNICEAPVKIHFVGGDHITLIQRPHVEDFCRLWIALMKL